MVTRLSEAGIGAKPNENRLQNPAFPGVFLASSSQDFGTPKAQRTVGNPPADMDRAEWMAAAYLAGFTLKEIGDSYGLTRERVRQILSHVLTRDQVRAGREAQRAARQAEREAKAPKADPTTTVFCIVCWDKFETRDRRQIGARINSCRPEHRVLYWATRHRIDRESWLQDYARSVVRTGNKSNAQVRWAARTLAGVGPTRASYWTGYPDSKAALAYAEVLRLREGKTPPAQEAK